MKWFLFVVIAAVILLVFAVVYGITGVLNKRKQPKYKTTAPDDDPKFLRDLAEKLKAQEENKPDSNTDGSAADSDSADGDKPGDK